jgi:hypothetical protein
MSNAAIDDKARIAQVSFTIDQSGIAFSLHPPVKAKGLGTSTSPPESVHATSRYSHAGQQTARR